MKKFLALILAFVMIGSILVACTGKNDDTDDSKPSANNGDDVVNSGSVETDAPRYTFIERDKKTDYVIVHPSNLDGQLNSQIALFKKGLNDSFAIDIQSATTSASQAVEHEILIGKTGRTESKDAATLISGNNEYIIKLYDSGKLVIMANNDSMLIQALKYLLNNYIYDVEGDFAFEANFEYKYSNVNATRSGWGISGLPSYWGGMLSMTYSTGHGLDLSNSSAGGDMHVISDTNLTEFNEYLDNLKAAGFKESASHTIGENKYHQFYKGNSVCYTYYTPSQNEVRVIHDTASTPEPIFEYAYSPRSGDVSTFYQYALMIHPTSLGGEQESTGFDNAGLCNVIKLADNSVILIDGGDDYQATDAAVDAYWQFIKDITGNSKVTVAAIFLTHGHGDHVYLTSRLIDKYGSDIIVERAMYNLPYIACEEFSYLGRTLKSNYPTIKFQKLHTGQNIQLANAQFEVMYTHEDLVSSTGTTEIQDYNNTSTVLKMTLNGKTMMILGDVGGQYGTDRTPEYDLWEKHFFAAFCPDGGTNYLKCDAVQVAHHGLNAYMGNLYAKIQAYHAFLPAADCALSQYAYSHLHRRIIENQLKPYTGSTNRVYGGNRYTYGWDISNGGSVSIKYRAIGGTSTKYNNLLNRYSALHSPSGTKI